MPGKFDPLKPVVRRLARRLNSEDAGIALAQFQLLKLLAQGAANPPPPSAPPAVDRVGIWEKKPGPSGTEFIRSVKASADWCFWADIERIPAKSARKRIVWLGESVARGYFFDPEATPAQFLESVLQQNAHDAEVIDLAKNGLQPGELSQLLSTVAELQPDALVVFAGNNWCSGSSLSFPELMQLCECLPERPEEFIAQFSRHLQNLAERLVGQITATAEKLGIPAIIVVPEFNLADWRDDWPPAIFSGNIDTRWRTLKARAETQLAAGQLAAAQASLNALAKLDHNLAPTTAQMRGALHLARQQTEPARAAFEQGRDVALLGASNRILSPRCPRIIQDTIRRRAAASARVQIVDVPALFAAQAGVPGNRFFMDYCHLTAEGISVVVHAVAQQLSVLRPETAAASLQRVPLPIAARTEAIAHFLAAIYNSFWGQPQSLLQHHCTRAISLYPAIVESMFDFVEFRSAPRADWVYAACQRLCSVAQAKPYLDRFIQKKVPLRLVLAIRQTLPRAAQRKRFDTLLLKRAAPAASTAVNLLDDPFHFTVHHFPLLFRSNPLNLAHYVAKDPTSEFTLPLSRATPMRIALCCRLPLGHTANKEVTLKLNGRRLRSFTLNGRWQKLSIPVAARLLKKGLNTFSIHWPAAGPRVNQALLTREINRLERDRFIDLFPSHGEISQFLISAADFSAQSAKV
ncbi:hypothetical protein [Oleiharenicola lentus]|uniref:hypothetical protein n=1 Tax=Oleiharenicola lentus TaxID=2508720 RepID=UPI003F674B0B